MKTSLKLYLTALVASFLFLLGACSTNTNSSTSKSETSSSSPTEVTIKSSLGVVTLSKVPEKIVTFDLGAADTIRALGFEKNIVGIPTKTVPTYLKDLAGKVKNVGSMVEPDLIIASPRTQKFVDKFNEIAPTVLFQAGKDDYWTSTKANIESLASSFGETGTQKAKEELAKLDKSVQEVATKNESSDKKALAILLNEGKMAAFGAQSRFSFLYQTLKFKPTDTKFEDSRHGQEVSFESVKEINPDILFVINRTLAIGGDNSSNDGVLENALIAETPAAKNGKIIQLTPDLWYLSGGGLESTKLMIEDAQKALK
ncbi:siderophore ABC transporter substrate-binding protein [Streptococcus mitis]|uniref:Putative ABC transporter solute-binding protein YclQ n=1 Tax=Streptococcus mitis TaxID=28037 RepID=A0A428ECG8_STRMT|nr:siderophore ABC transporter substrate-binding protein [Streptococcus mitis]RSJ07733.1 putative ABC transporter solute-binding protein YclQ precursor [Streptococcus mitis]